MVEVRVDENVVGLPMKHDFVQVGMGIGDLIFEDEAVFRKGIFVPQS